MCQALPGFSGSAPTDKGRSVASFVDYANLVLMKEKSTQPHAEPESEWIKASRVPNWVQWAFIAAVACVYAVQAVYHTRGLNELWAAEDRPPIPTLEATEARIEFGEPSGGLIDIPNSVGMSGKHSPFRVANTVALANYHLLTDAPELAIPVYEQALAVLSRTLGTDHPEATSVQTNLDSARALAAEKRAQ